MKSTQEIVEPPSSLLSLFFLKNNEDYYDPQEWADFFSSNHQPPPTPLQSTLPTLPFSAPTSLILSCHSCASVRQSKFN